jgi:hypothetical protein
MNIEDFLTLFDLHLIIFRSMKEESETKIDFDMKLNELSDLGLIKNYRFPFFYFKDNTNSDFQIKLNKDYYKEINEFEDYRKIYKKYLPRNNAIDFIKKNPVINI